MSNELLWILTLLLTFSMVLIAYKLFGRAGLYGWIALIVILSNVQVLKTVDVFGFVASAGNILYSTSFLVTDILSEIYGKKSATKAVWIGFFTLVATTIIMQLTLNFAPHISDWANEPLQTVFGFFPRVAFAGAVAYLISQMNDVRLYHYLKRIFPSPGAIWIRNNGSTMISQLLDTVIFCALAFWGVFESPVFWSIMVTMYIMKLIVAVCDTPFIYLARKLYIDGDIPREEKEGYV